MASAATVSSPVTFSYFVPSGRLGEFVALFWYCRGHEVQYSKERVLPMPTSELVIKLGSERSASASICGPRSESFIIERTALDELIGIHFKLGGIFPFLDFPLSELHGLNVTLADVCGERQSHELVCRLH